MQTPIIIYWSRRDFRLTDNPALMAALKESKEKKVPFLPLFILEDYMVEGNPEFQFGYPSRWLLAKAVPHFAKQFSQFAVVRGTAARYLIELSKVYACTVHVNDDVYPDFYRQVEKLNQAGARVCVHDDALTVSKDTRTGQGNLYSVFTPFKKAVWSSFVRVSPLPRANPAVAEYVSQQMVESLPHRVDATEEVLQRAFSKQRLLRVGDDVINLDEYTSAPQLEGWYTHEVSALERFMQYLNSGDLEAYGINRDSLERDAESGDNEHAEAGKTSRMSVALAWGMVSARMLMAHIRNHFEESFDNPFSDRVSQGALTYISELIWREFYRYQLFHHPELMDTEFQERFRGTIAWTEKGVAKERFLQWIKGETGYPIVDAAMHQLAATGWMHNRARMIVASVLTKNFGVDWRWGQEYFRSALIDLDEASNNGGWQWGASVGTDPKPIRIFNPELQAKNYDASGVYRSRWLASENIILRTQTAPIIEHKVAREEALRRYGLQGVKPRDY